MNRELTFTVREYKFMLRKHMFIDCEQNFS